MNQENKKREDKTKTALHKYHSVKKLCELGLLLTLIGAGVAQAKASDITPKNILIQINYQRELRGIKPLQEDTRLDQAAVNKSTDMIDKDYFEHYAHGLTPWKFIENQKYDYLYAGENLAMDFQTSEGMVRAWMSSSAHRKNILNPDYDDIGIGVVKGEYTDDHGSRETNMVTNMFGKEKPAILKLFDAVVNRLKNIF